MFIQNFKVKLVDYGFLWGHIYDDGGFDDFIDSNHEANRALTGMYLTKDGRWVLPHFGLNNLRERMLSLLKADASNQVHTDE